MAKDGLGEGLTEKVTHWRVTKNSVDAPKRSEKRFHSRDSTHVTRLAYNRRRSQRACAEKPCWRARAVGVEVCCRKLENQEMSTIPVELPDHLQSYVDETAEQAGFASASEYIVALVAAASEKQGEIEQALIAGIKSGSAEPWTDDEWQAIRSRVVSKALSK